MATRYVKGNIVQSAVEFSQGDAFVAPTTVVFRYRTPAGVLATHTFGSSLQLLRDSQGKYHIDVDLSAVGFWYWRWEATGGGHAADEGFWEVTFSAF